jgi:hypothetical protein
VLEAEAAKRLSQFGENGLAERAIRSCILNVYDDLERLGRRGVSERFVSIQDMVKLEPMGDQLLRIELSRPDSLQQHRGRYGVDEPRGDGDVLRPETLKV